MLIELLKLTAALIATAGFFYFILFGLQYFGVLQLKNNSRKQLAKICGFLTLSVVLWATLRPYVERSFFPLTSPISFVQSAMKANENDAPQPPTATGVEAPEATATNAVNQIAATPPFPVAGAPSAIVTLSSLSTDIEAFLHDPDPNASLVPKIRIQLLEYKDQASVKKLKIAFQRFNECEKIFFNEALKSCEQRTVIISAELKACFTESAQLINRPKMADPLYAESYFGACAGKSAGMKITDQVVREQIKANAERAQRLQELFAN